MKIKIYTGIILLCSLAISIWYYRMWNRHSDATFEDTMKVKMQNKQSEEIKNIPEITKANTTVIEGVITIVNDNGISISTNQAELNLGFSDSVSVYSMDGGNIKIQNISDLKRGMGVILEYDQDSKQIISLKLIQ